jgi:integrase
LNWERGTAHIVQTVAADKSNRGAAFIQDRAKTKAASRTVRLTAETLAVLREHLIAQNQRRSQSDTWHDNDLIVCTSYGTPVNPNNVSRSFQALVRASGVRRIRVHDLRHTHASLLLRAGVSAKVVSERLGHASIAITLDTYSHVLPDMQDAAADAMSAIVTAGQSSISRTVSELPISND